MPHLPRADGNRSRRSFLAVLAGSAAGLAAGCSTSDTAPPAAPSVPLSPTASTPTAARTSPRPATPARVSSSPRPAAPASSSPRPPAPAAAEIVRRATVPVLCYHQLREWRSGDSAYARSDLICPPKNFRRHLDALAGDGWTTISPDAYLAHLTTGAGLPAKPVLLTFDDGSRTHVAEALPQLAKRDMTATFFPMTVVLGKPSWLRNRDVTKLAEAGMTIGCHTYDHPGVDAISGRRAWKQQLEQPRETLRELSHQPVDHFAYPFGILRRRAYEHLEQAGYRTAFQLKEHKVDRAAPLYSLRRFIVGSTWSGDELLRQVQRNRG